MGALLGETGWGLLVGVPVDNERKAQETGVSLHGASIWQPGMSLPTGDFETCL
jgi:hypothetical protein